MNYVFHYFLLMTITYIVNEKVIYKETFNWRKISIAVLILALPLLVIYKKLMDFIYWFFSLE